MSPGLGLTRFPASKYLIKVAISYVSIEGARKNLAAELPDWDFDKVRAEAKAAWNKELSKIEVSGGTPEQTTNFYTALYHTMIQPNIFNDVDGRIKDTTGRSINCRSESRTPSAMSTKAIAAIRTATGGRGVRGPTTTPSSLSGTRSAPPIRFTRSSTRNARSILSTPLSAYTNRAGGCRFGSCGAKRPIP